MLVSPTLHLLIDELLSLIISRGRVQGVAPSCR